jgi:hypothetical protein
MLQAGLEIIGGNIAFQATLFSFGREHPEIWGFRPVFWPIEAQCLVACFWQYHPPFLISLALGYPQEPHPCRSICLYVRVFQLS